VSKQDIEQKRKRKETRRRDVKATRKNRLTEKSN
jgi:nucleolar complex protein 3